MQVIGSVDAVQQLGHAPTRAGIRIAQQPLVLVEVPVVEVPLDRMPGACSTTVTLLQPSFPFAPGMSALTCEKDHRVEGLDADRGCIAEQGCVGGDHHPGDLGRRAAH
jgi:hypothetical protein